MDQDGELLFDEIKRYVGFGPADEAALVAIGPRVEPHVASIIDDFYSHIMAHPGARRSITGGDEQVDRLKGTLQVWLRGLFMPPWDQGYYERRARIGRRHVHINLPQQYMFTAVNVIRCHLVNVVLDTAPDLATARPEILAVERLLDMELAIMLHTYQEDSLERLRRGERLATFGQLVASIAHELRNPLGVIESSLFLLRKRVGTVGEPVTRHLDKIESQVKRSNRIITNLLDMVRDRPSVPRATALRELVAGAMDALPADVTRLVTVDIPPLTPLAWVDPDHGRQIVLNLLANALEAAGPTGQVAITAHTESQGVTVSVGDSGPGIDPSIRARLFEPLVTTRAQGIGLGLALCRRLAERNSGRITLAEGALPGASFALWLPRAAGPLPEPPGAQNNQGDQGDQGDQGMTS